MSEMAFHPGSYITDEMAARGWSQRDFALAAGLSDDMADKAIHGLFTVSMAEGCARAFGTSVEIWLNLWHRYEVADKAVARA